MRITLLRAVLAAAVLCSLIGTSLAQAALFTDVPDNHPHIIAIKSLKDAGIISGYGDGTFRPDAPVSRAEAVAVILKAAGITSQKTSLKLPFTDVSQDAWYFPMIQKGVNLGKIKGYEDKTFRPSNPVTLPEALAFTFSFFSVSMQGVKVESVIYEGLDAKAWYASRAQYAKNMLIIEPDLHGHIDPGTPLTRSQLIEIAYRMLEVKKNGKPFDVTTDWMTTEHIDNFWKIRHPSAWEIFKGSKNSALWKPQNGQNLFTRVWPEGVRLALSVIDNPDGQTAAQYFAKLKESYTKAFAGDKVQFSEFLLSGRNALKIALPQSRAIDMYIALPNKNFLGLYGDYGSAALGELNKKHLEFAIMSYTFIEKPPEPRRPVIPLEKRMEMLREKILIEGAWTEINLLFPDKKLIHTDAIGIGTGPVDYYFSAEASHTIKLERNSSTILNIKEGSDDGF